MSIPISRRAVIQRIKRVLAKRGQYLVACRTGECLFYVTDGRTSDQWHRLDLLAEWASVLKPYESFTETIGNEVQLPPPKTTQETRSPAKPTQPSKWVCKCGRKNFTPTCPCGARQP